MIKIFVREARTFFIGSMSSVVDGDGGSDHDGYGYRVELFHRGIGDGEVEEIGVMESRRFECDYWS